MQPPYAADTFVAAAVRPLQQQISARLAARRFQPLSHIELVLTERCNHRCDYCFMEGKRDARDMPFDVARKGVDFFLASGPPSRDCDLMFFGGEPLLVFPLLAEVVAYARHRAAESGMSERLTFSITTNGTLLTEEMAWLFQRERILYLLSIDGDRETHDAHRRMSRGGSSYDTVMARLPLMKAYQPWQGARVTVRAEHAGRVHHNIMHLAGAGINQFIIGPAIGPDWTAADVEAYGRSLTEAAAWVHTMRLAGAPLRLSLVEEDIDRPPGSRKGQWGCGAGRGRACVDADGFVYPCAKMYGVQKHRKEWVLGDLWQGMTQYVRRGRMHSTSEALRPKCAECDIKDDCGGGCPAVNLQATGDPFSPSEADCALTRVMLRVRSTVAEFVRTHPMPAGAPQIPATGGLRHIRPVG